MSRPSLLITRLLGAPTAALAILVGLSSQAQALRPDPGGAPRSAPPVSGTTSSAWSEPVLWIAVAVAVVILALATTVAVRMRQRPLLRHAQPSPSA